MATVRSLNINVGANSKKLERELIRSARTVNKFGANVTRSLNKLARNSALATAAAIAGFAALSKRSIDLADQNIKLARSAGLTFESYQRLSETFRLAGLNGTFLTRATGNLSRVIFEASKGTLLYRDALDRLGVSIFELEALDLEQQFHVIRDALSEVENGADQLALAQILLGRVGREAGSLIRLSSQEARGYGLRLQSLGGVMRDDVAVAAEVFNDQISTISTVLHTQFTTALLDSGRALGIFNDLDDLIRLAGQAVYTTTRAIVEFANQMYRWRGVIFNVTAAWIALNAVVFTAAVIRSIGSLVRAIKALVTIMRNLRFVTLSTQGAFLLIPAAIATIVVAGAAAAFAIYKEWDGVKTFFINLAENIKLTFERLWLQIRLGVQTTVVETFQRAASAVVKDWGDVAAYFENLALTIRLIFEQMWLRVGLSFQSTIDRFLSTIERFSNGIKTSIEKNDLAFFKEGFNKEIDNSGSVVASLRSEIQALALDLENAKRVGVELGEAVGSFGEEFLLNKNNISGPSDIVRRLQENIKVLDGELAIAAERTGESFGEMSSNLISVLKSTIDDAIAYVTGAVEEIAPPIDEGAFAGFENVSTAPNLQKSLFNPDLQGILRTGDPSLVLGDNLTGISGIDPQKFFTKEVSGNIRDAADNFAQLGQNINLLPESLQGGVEELFPAPSAFERAFIKFRDGALQFGDRIGQTLSQAIASGNYDNLKDAFLNTIIGELVSSLASSATKSAIGFFGGFFHEGGIVPGQSGQDVPIIAQAGELVLTRDQQRALGNAGGLQVVVRQTLVGDVTQATRRAMLEDGRALADVVQGEFIERRLIQA